MTDRKEIIKLAKRVNELPMQQAFVMTDKDGYVDYIEYRKGLRPFVNMSPIAFAEMARAL